MQKLKIMNRLKLWIKSKIDAIRYQMSKEACYDVMEERGIASFGMCNGVVGGDRYTEYLSYQCVDCPYHVFVKKKKELNNNGKKNAS